MKWYDSYYDPFETLFVNLNDPKEWVTSNSVGEI